MPHIKKIHVFDTKLHIKQIILYPKDEIQDFYLHLFFSIK